MDRVVPWNGTYESKELNGSGLETMVVKIYYVIRYLGNRELESVRDSTSQRVDKIGDNVEFNLKDQAIASIKSNNVGFSNNNREENEELDGSHDFDGILMVEMQWA
ncbi:hypothetical protein PVK06_043472 [Gossypium arboreum]|uniref:Uncharacterized protein n=1 Tax=Gossypium arboreum TaxID=29729 RepID=A0ABR0MNY0_GOSAR|nr:hypothetical protein PVK06_043472 [Gossypium arboreum]